jgi:acyl carrier protein
MSEKECISLIAELMELEDDSLIDRNTMLDDLEEYDSFFKLYLTSHMKKKNIRLSIEEIMAFQTIGDICDYLMKHDG